MSSQSNRDKWFFVGCMLLAILFWVMQKLSNNYTFVQRYTVTYAIPDGKVFKKAPPSIVEVTMSGKGWDLISKSAKTIGDKIEVELSSENNQLIPASSIAEKINSILASNDITVSQIKPSIINILLEDQASKKVPVRSKLNINFLTGFYIKNKLTFTPDSVVVTGSTQLIKDIEFWNTQIVNINKLNKNIEHMPISLEEPQNELVRVSPLNVKLNLEVEEFTEKTFELPIIVKNSDQSVKLIPDKVKIKCTLGISKYDQISESDIEMYVNLDASLIKNDANVVPISISRLPDYIRHTEFQPKSAKFFIVKQ